MVPTIEKLLKLNPDQTVVCIRGNEDIPDILSLSTTEKEYVKRCQVDKPGYILINSYFRLTILVNEIHDKGDDNMLEKLRETASKLVEEFREHRQLTVAVISHRASSKSVEAFTEGLLLGSYTFSPYRTKADPGDRSHYPENIYIEDGHQGLTDRLKALASAVFFARDRVNEPLSHLGAQLFSEKISDFCGSAGLEVETLGKKQLEALKMGGILAVNRGSKTPPVLSIVSYRSDKAINSKPVVLVGKGVVFDSGGLNLKPTDYIEDMKSDMAGGAAVAAVMYYIAKRQLPLNVMALVPATDNRPGEDAYAPGDVITMYNGSTVEVLNTDAEGRMILADAVSYAAKYDPALIITVATLTGSAQMTFGSKAIAAMGNAPGEIFKLLDNTGYQVNERIGVLPFWDDYLEMLKSDIADLKNIGGREAGAITAGKFLESFAGAPFIHLDIAGTAMLKKADHYRPKGGTGSGVRLLAEFLERLSVSNIEL